MSTRGSEKLTIQIKRWHHSLTGYLLVQMADDAKAVFGCGWQNAENVKSRLFRDRHRQHMLYDIVKMNVVTELYRDDLAIDICYYTINGSLVGFWYPSSSAVDFDKAEEFLRGLAPQAIMTDLANVFHVIIKCQGPSDEETVGFVECGHKSSMECEIDYLSRRWENEKVVVGAEIVNVGPIYLAREAGMGVSVYVSYVKIPGQTLVFWYASTDGVGNLDLATKVVTRLYPNAELYDLSQLETFLRERPHE